MKPLRMAVLSGFLLVFCSMACPQVTLADAEAELKAGQERLEEIQQQIEAGLRDLRSKQARAVNLSGDLDRLDVEIRRLAAAVRRSRSELEKIDVRIAALQKERNSLQTASEETQDKVRRRLTVLYKGGEIGLAKVLLGATATPYEVAENQFYLARMVRHDRQLIDDYRTQVNDLEKKLVELQELRETQARVTERRAREQSALGKAGQDKRRLLTEIRKDEALLSEYLAELREKAARLSDLVKKLETDLVQTYTEGSSPFQEQKGRLAWPVDGQLRVGFGTTRNVELGTLLESNGLEITASVGTPVKAVWGGKVLYSSPFRGYGNLMIIDHGGKYYSLYAHVAQFAKHSGDQVAVGETIAYTGFEGRDFLYFEVRHSGKPLDPLPWLETR
jgi:septal ring factor EnvC (AmiA/AmiB activator)